MGHQTNVLAWMPGQYIIHTSVDTSLDLCQMLTTRWGDFPRLNLPTPKEIGVESLYFSSQTGFPIALVNLHQTRFNVQGQT